MTDIITSMSAIDTFYRCRRKFSWQEIEGWIPRGGVGRSATLGTGFHLCLSDGYRSVRDFDDAYQKFALNPDTNPYPWAELDPAASAARELSFISIAAKTPYEIMTDRDGATLSLTDEDRELLEDMVRYFWQEQGAAELKTITRIISVEEPVYLKVIIGERTYWIRNTLDLAVNVVGNQKAVVIDHKTGDPQQAMSFISLDPQMRFYWAAARAAHGEVSHFIHNFIDRDVPPGFGHRPLTTATGRARAKKSLENMQDPTRYIKRVETPFSNSEIDAFEADLRNKLTEIDRTVYDTKYFPPSPIKGHYPGCDGCPYFAPCGALVAGHELGIGAIELSYIIRDSDEHKQLLAGETGHE